MQEEKGTSCNPYFLIENVERARNGLENTLIEANPKFHFHGWMHTTDKNTGDILYFFHSVDFENRPYAEEFLSSLRTNWQEAGFKIVEERTVSVKEFSFVKFPSLFFRLKHLK